MTARTEPGLWSSGVYLFAGTVVWVPAFITRTVMWNQYLMTLQLRPVYGYVRIATVDSFCAIS